MGVIFKEAPSNRPDSENFFFTSARFVAGLS